MAAISTIQASESNQTLSGTGDKDRIIIGGTTSDGETLSYTKVSVAAGAGNDTVHMQIGSANYIDAGAGNDSVILGENSSASTVVTGEGNDTVVIWATDTTTVELGSGSNVIMLAADANLVISAASDADIQYVLANGASIGKTTISGSGGAELRGTGGSDLFVPGTGNNTIVGYGGEDTIQFTSSSQSVSGNDVILVGSNGTLTVANGAAHKLNVNGNTVSLGSYTTYTPQEVIKKFMASLDGTSKTGTAALDEAVLSLNVDAFGSMQDVIDAAVADCKALEKSGGADVFLRDYCGIILDNKDTGALTGWDAMGSTVKTADNVVPESGSFDTFSQDSFTVNGLTVSLATSFSDLTDNQKTIYRGLHTWWTSAALNLISDSYGTKFSFGSGDNINSGAKTITVKFVGKGSFLAQVQSTAVKGETASALELQINESYYNPIDSSNVNGYSTVRGSGYLDRTLAHEFTHAIMAATIQDFNSLPAYITEGMAELTHGIDDERATLISSLGGSSSKLKNALGNSTKTGNVNNYAGGYILLRYMAQQAANSEPATGVRVKGKSAVITATGDNTITTVDGSGEKFDEVVTLDASSSSRNVYIIGNDKDNVIIGNSTGGTLNGGSGKDKLYGSAGTDVFVHSIGSGSDVIGNTKDATSLYTTGDKIVIVGDSSITADGALTFKDAKGALTVSFKDSKETLTINKADSLAPVTIELATVVGGSALKSVTHGEVPTGVMLDSKNAANVTIGAAAPSTVDISDINTQVKTVDAKGAGAIRIIGSNYAATTVSLGGNNTTVLGGYDYAKDKGLNDVFYGSDGGKDVFVYSLGGGSDKIVNYSGADGDAIVLLGYDDVTTIGTSGDVSYKESAKGLTLTLNSGKTKGSLTIESIDSSSKLNVYKNSVSDANKIFEYGVIMPSGVSYGKSNAILTVTGGLSTSTVGIDLLGDGYSGNVKEVNASTYNGRVNIVGNNNSDALTSGIAGGTLDGGYDTAKNKATGDKLYGNAGADTFIYRSIGTIGGGTDIIGGNKSFETGNYESQDRIIITADTAPSASDIVFTDAKDITTITINGDKKSKLTVNKATSDTAITVYPGANDGNLSNLTTAVTHGSVPSGVAFGKKGTSTDYTTLSIGSASANSTIDASSINSQIKTIDATNASYLVKVVGNAGANNISLGAAGGTMDGGAGNDKLFGGSGNDVFYYALGDGNDEINNYDGSKDMIVISGYSDTIDVTNSKIFKDNNGTVTIDLASGTAKGKLTLKNAAGKLTIRDTAGKTLLDYRENVPDAENITFVKNIMSIGGGASLGNANTFKASDYGVNIKGIDASAYSTKALYLIAGDIKNTSYDLTAGAAGSTLKGGAGTDKMYGSSGADVFVCSVGGGNDVINSLHGAEGDYVVILGRTEAIDVNDAKVFKDSGKDITLTLNNQKITIKNPDGQLKVIGAMQNENTGAITLGGTLLTYGANLPTGVEYQSNKTVLAVTENATASSLALDISDTAAYYSKLKNVNATVFGGAVNITGNGLANELRAGKGSSTLNGGAGNDVLYGNSAGADVFVLDMNSELKNGKDVVRNYNQANGDVIKLENVDASSVKATYNEKTLILTAAGSSDSQKTATFTIYGTTDNFKTYDNIDSTTKIAISINGESHTYQFITKNSKAKLLSEMVADGEATRDGQSGQLSAGVDDYWFTQPTDADFDAGDELTDIMEINPIAESSNLNALSELLDQSDQMFAPSSFLKGASRHGARNK